MGKDKSIPLSPKYGLNPAIPVCFYCGKDKNEIVLPGRMKGDVEAPAHAVWDREPCDDCKKFMEQGIILIQVRDGETDMTNPYRLGGFVVATEEAVRRWLTGDVVEEVCRKRVCFVPDEVWRAIGLDQAVS